MKHGNAREIPRILLDDLARYDNFSEFSGKILLISGPNSSGKTHIIQKYLSEVTKDDPDSVMIIDGYNMENKIELMYYDADKVNKLLQNKKYLFIDDAHRIPQISKIAQFVNKLLPDLQIILAFSTRELEDYPIIRVYPVALCELTRLYNTTPEKELLDELLIYGCLPTVLNEVSFPAKAKRLRNIISREVLKDLFEIENINGSKSIMELIGFLAVNINQNLSTREIARVIDVNPRTALRYIEFLKKYYIIHEHKGYRSGSHKEISKLSKFYFYDNGIRNAFLNDFRPLKLREDTDQLWANFLVIERHKLQGINHISHTSQLESFFWKAWETNEIDLIEVGLGQNISYGMHAFKFTYSPNITNSFKAPVFFRKLYPDAIVEEITPDNYQSFINL